MRMLVAKSRLERIGEAVLYTFGFGASAWCTLQALGQHSTMWAVIFGASSFVLAVGGYIEVRKAKKLIEI
jgi:hypothetical protein